MSGTSMDGITAALVDFSTGTPEIHSSLTEPYPEPLKQALLELALPNWYGSLSDLLRLDHLTGKAFAATAENLIARTNIDRSSIRAIGSHGQTVWHEPAGETPNTLQIGNPSIITETTRISVVTDFRRRDMANGGQGAPLAPAFHAEVFASDNPCAILNLGGIANVTLLPGNTDSPVIGFDTGPANMLMDAWTLRHLGAAYDHNGDWARSGKLDPDMLEAMLEEPYFSATPPKSTGREDFNLIWLSQFLKDNPGQPEDIQNTLAELTARTVTEALKPYQPMKELIVCGGGVHNSYVMQRLTELLPRCDVLSSAEKGVDPDLVEAIAFAWLARKTLHGETGNLPSVTGAAATRVLGAIYPS